MTSAGDVVTDALLLVSIPQGVRRCIESLAESIAKDGPIVEISARETNRDDPNYRYVKHRKSLSL